MSDRMEHRTIDTDIAYFRFLKGAGATDFYTMFPEFQALVERPEIDKMVIDIQMNDAWGGEIQDIWLQTGEFAEGAGIKRWGVVTPESSKKMTIRHLIKGGRARNRAYETYVSDSLDEVLQWIRS